MKLAKRLGLTIVVAGVLGLGFASLLVWHYSRDIPEIGSVKDYRPALGMRIYDRKGRLIHSYAKESRQLAPFEQIPIHVRQAFLAAEDAGFYHHFGFDPMAIMRAAARAALAGKIKGGGSTITQQLAKNLFLSPERSIKRKIQELIFARRLEQALTKDEILFLYLNEIYLGRGAFGVGAAANNYFGKSITEVTIAEAAILAGLPQRPGTAAPHINPEAARSRQMYTLGQMERNKMITPEQAAEARSTPVPIVASYSESSKAPWVTEMVRQWAIEHYGEVTAYTNGLQIWTTIDLDAVQTAQEAVAFGTEEIERSNGYRGPVTRLAPREVDDFVKQEWSRIQHDWVRARSEWVTTLPMSAHRAVSFPTEVSIYEATGGDAMRAVVMETLPGLRSLVVRIGPYTGIVAEEGLVLGRYADYSGQEDRYPPYPKLEDFRHTFHTGDVIWVRAVFPDLEKGNTRNFVGSWQKVLAWQQRNRPEIKFQAQLVEKPVVEAGLISIEPHTGDILAVVGGRDFFASQFNRVIQAKRQVGSTIKPLVYSAALDAGYTITHTVEDTRLRFEDLQSGMVWRPKNYSNNIKGEPVTLLDALTKSKNIITVQIANDIGVRAIVETMRNFGIQDDIPEDLSLALGSASLSPIDIARAYASFSAGGLLPNVKLIHEVRTSAGEVLYTAPYEQQIASPWAYEDRLPQPTGIEKVFASRPDLPRELMQEEQRQRALTDTTAYIITNMLESVVQRGTGFRARALGRPAAGKTGTTNDNVDSWFSGFVPQLTTIVWVGYDNIQPIGPIMTGSRAAAPIWLEYMQSVLKDVPVADFAVPANIALRKIDPSNGYLATLATSRPWLGAFVRGTEPTIESQSQREEKAQENQIEDDLLGQLQ